MYCKKCGDELLKSDSNYNNGEHNKCRRTLRHCSYCGEKENDNTTFFSTGAFVYCQASIKKCYYDHKEELENEHFNELLKLYPSLSNIDDSIKEDVIKVVDELYWHDSENAEEFLKTLDGDGYVIIYNDSDGYLSYEVISNNKEVLDYIIKSKHRMELGMNCRLYVDTVIQNGVKVNWDED